MAAARPNFSNYLKSLIDTYRKWWRFDVFTENLGDPYPFDFQLVVQRQKKQEERDGEQKQVEQLGILEGIRKYADHGNVLLTGRPGAGKSTSLIKLLVKLADEALQNPQAKIPILIELKFYKIPNGNESGLLLLIQVSLAKRGLSLEPSDIKQLLVEKRFFLLIDGLNELPEEKARGDLKRFLRICPTHVVFTTRDLGLSGDLGIQTQLELQSLNNSEVQQFFGEWISGQSRQKIQELSDRVRELGQTPLIAWMLYVVFRQTGEVPETLGEVLREYTRRYESQKKEDAPISDESRQWWFLLLRNLAFMLMHSEQATDFRLVISRVEAEGIFKRFLEDEKATEPSRKARALLDELIKHHLIQVKGKNQIGFCHQLLQEYYAAEYLLEMLEQKHPDVANKKRFQHYYLNYLKWTEAIALMLGLLDKKNEALQIIRFATDIDVFLGARLAGEVKREFQKDTIELVQNCKLPNQDEIPQWLRVELLGRTRLELVIPLLNKEALNNPNRFVRYRAIELLGEIDSDIAIPILVELITKDSDGSVEGSKAADALGNIGSKAVVKALLQVIQDFEPVDRWAPHPAPYYAREAIRQIKNEAAVSELLQAVKKSNSEVRESATLALQNIGSGRAIEALLSIIRDSNFEAAGDVIRALGIIGCERAVPDLLQLLSRSDSDESWHTVAWALGEIGSEEAVEPLCKVLKESSNDTFREQVAQALGKIGCEKAILTLLTVLRDESNMEVRWEIYKALGHLGSEVGIDALVEIMVSTSDFNVRWRTTEALATIASKSAVPALLKLVKHPSDSVRRSAIVALGYISVEDAVPVLTPTLRKDIADPVREGAATALGEIGSVEAIQALIEAATESSEPSPVVREHAAIALGKIGSEAAGKALVEIAENDSSWRVQSAAFKSLEQIISSAITANFTANTLKVIVSELLRIVESSESNGLEQSAVRVLGIIGSDTATGNLIKVMDNHDPLLRFSAAYALGQIGSSTAIPVLLQAMKDSDSRVSGSASVALGKIRGDAAGYSLPDLISLISLKAKEDEDRGADIIRAISGIQAQCQFYNYDTAHSSLPPPVLKINDQKEAIVTYDFSGASFPGVVNFGSNSGTQIGTQNNLVQNPEDAQTLTEIEQFLKNLQKNQAAVTDQQQLEIIDAEFEEIRLKEPEKWKRWMQWLSVVFAGGTEAVKVIYPWAGIPIEAVRKLCEIYEKNRQMLPEGK
jgi:HEAT repeat protein